MHNFLLYRMKNIIHMILNYLLKTRTKTIHLGPVTKRIKGRCIFIDGIS